MSSIPLCHSERSPRSEDLFPIARFLCDESLFDLNFAQIVFLGFPGCVTPQMTLRVPHPRFVRVGSYILAAQALFFFQLFDSSDF